MKNNRLSNIDSLRAIAALCVCIFHFDRNSFIGIEWLSEITQYGYLGVEVFFVISGFIIPFSLERSGYRLPDFPSFITSRFIRLYPAYLLTIVATIGLWHISTLIPGFKGSPPLVTGTQLASNVLLISDLQGEAWISPIFWTLAIETQFYFLIGLSYLGFISKNKFIQATTIFIWLIFPLMTAKGYSVFSWTSLLLVGIIGFLWKSNRISFFLAIFYMTLALFVHAKVNGFLACITGAATIFAILFAPDIKSRLLVWLSTISYSLYLLHVPFGGRVINLAERLPDVPTIRILAIALALTISLIAAVLFYKLVEEPSHRLSKIVRNYIQGFSQQDFI